MFTRAGEVASWRVFQECCEIEFAFQQIPLPCGGRSN
jgi:hypothetical protein